MFNKNGSISIKKRIIQMKQLFLLFSHTLTDGQKQDAKNSLLVESFISLTPQLQKLWSNIPEDKRDINKYL